VRKNLLLFLLSLIVLAGVLPARAQSAARLELFALDASAFPTISASMDVFDPGGAFITGLQPGQVTLLEDDLPIAPTSLQELQPGVQFAIALDPGAAFAFQDAHAISRFDLVMNVLIHWAEAHADAFNDELSLVPTDAVISSNLSAASFASALAAYQPDLQTIRPTLDSLSHAIDLVSDAGSQIGMKRVLLYITSPLESASIPALQSLTQRAIAMDVRVHVWVVSSPDFFTTSGATALKDLSILTGGTYALFSGEESLPDPEAYLTPLRHTYALRYPSAIRTSGSHTLVLQVESDGATLTSEPVSFDLVVEPPNPMLVTPPGQILRQGPDLQSTDFALFQPASQEIEAIIEFTDGIQRPLIRTGLYVDGVLVDENISEPFDLFTWDLSGITSSGEHILQVQALDSLGLQKTSLGLTVSVTVVLPERGVRAFLSRNSLWVTLGAVGLAGAALVTTLLVGRRGSQHVPARKTGRRGGRDPLTAQVDDVSEERPRRALHGRAASALKQSDAYLLRLKEDGQAITAPPIPISLPEMTFGSDPLHATRLLDDPSVSPLHARLKQENGQFILTDEKSTAGTWVNYEPLTAPRPLHNGDILHIGRIAYRFMLRKPPESPAPRLTPPKP
jgi:hypothetical protein